MLTQLQALRGWAAMSVMLFHLGASLAAPKYFGFVYLDYVTRFGYSGMLLFFVLSGFIIHQIHASDFNRPARAWRYITKRVLRIYPLYLVLFLLIAFFARATGIGADGIPTEWAELLPSLFLLPQNPDIVGGTGAPVIIVAWSLQYEMIFYTIVLIFIISWRVGWIVVLALVAIYTTYNVVGRTEIFPAYMEWKYFAFFAIGVGSSTIVNVGIPNPKAVFLRHASTVIFIATWGISTIIMILTEGQVALIRNSGVQIVLAIASAAYIIGVSEIERRGRGASAAVPVRHLGDWSYAIYLLHFPVISAVSKVAVAVGFGGVWAAIFVVIVCLTVTISVSALFHRVVERPAINLARISRRALRMSQGAS